MISSTTDGTRRPGARPRVSGASRATTEIASRLTNSTSGIEGSSLGRASTADVTEYDEQDGLCFLGEGLEVDRAESRRRGTARGAHRTGRGTSQPSRVPY